jgi:hypothetical protein
MEEELYELQDELKDAKTGHDFINVLLDRRDKDKNTSSQTMKNNNMFYIIGVVDALYYSKKITQEEYTNTIKYFGL